MPSNPSPFVPPRDMQDRLFAELSRMFGTEVPLYDKSLAVNRICNRITCDLLSDVHPGFAITTDQITRSSGERHGAIRIGKPDEYHWIARFFACFGMAAHNFYDMTEVGAKSQPVTASAFRSTFEPGHRIFASLLQPTYFDDDTCQRVETLLSTRQVFSENAKSLIMRCEADGGLGDEDAASLIAEGTNRIFKWTGRARDHQLYLDLCETGFKNAADIACFETHHLNHLTPNTFCIDLYTAAMKFCMGEWDEARLRSRAMTILTHFARTTDRHAMRLLFRHLTANEIDGFDAMVDADALRPVIRNLIDRLVRQLTVPDLDLTRLDHSGFKESTEGPPVDTPVLLRQDAYKALTEPVTFVNDDGSTIETVHTARFGEIEQRFYATTPEGRALYDECLADAEKARDSFPTEVLDDPDAYDAAYAESFARFPKTLPELLDAGLVFGRYSAADDTRQAHAIAVDTGLSAADLMAILLSRGDARVEGLRYEDFLPVSAAGIFASNLNQSDIQATATDKPTYTQVELETIIGRPIVESDPIYAGLEAASIMATFQDLGVLQHLSKTDRTRLESVADTGRTELHESMSPTSA